MEDTGLIDCKKLADAALSENGVIFDVSDVLPDETLNENDIFEDDFPLIDNDLENFVSLPFDISSFESLKEEMTDLWNSVVFKKVLKQGSGKSTPGDHFVVRIKYEAFLENIPQPYDQQTKRLRLDSNSMILGLEMGIKSMQFDEVSAFLIHPDAAYGNVGLYPLVPPNSHLLFRVEMIHFSSASPVDLYYDNPIEVRRLLPFAEVQRVVVEEKQEGNKSFSYKKYKSALRFYQRALRVLDERHPQNLYEQVQKNRLTVDINCNMALCYLRMKEYSECVRCCKNSLEIDPKCVKALYRVSQAFSGKGKSEKAIKYLRKAFELEPNNTQIGNDLIAVEEVAKKQKLEEENFFRKAFGLKPKEETVVVNVDEDFKQSAMEILNQMLEDSDCDDVTFDDFFGPHEKYFVYEKAKELNLHAERVGDCLKVSRKK